MALELPFLILLPGVVLVIVSGILTMVIMIRRRYRCPSGLRECHIARSGVESGHHRDRAEGLRGCAAIEGDQAGGRGDDEAVGTTRRRYAFIDELNDLPIPKDP
jgi:hypothetical protein